MGNRIFFDSNFFIGLINESDPLHSQALAVIQKLQGSFFQAVVSNFIISEVVTVLSLRVDKNLALNFADSAYRSFNLEIITVNRSIELLAINYLRQIKSKNISFCDCTTLAIMEMFGISYLATFDKDFKGKGNFEIL